jgi:hypothetical protein
MARLRFLEGPSVLMPELVELAATFALKVFEDAAYVGYCLLLEEML